MAVIVLDRFRRRHAHEGRLARAMAPASYGAFVAQGPVLVPMALALRGLDVPGDVKFLLLAPAAVIASYGLALAAVRLRRGRGSSRP